MSGKRNLDDRESPTGAFLLKKRKRRVRWIGPAAIGASLRV